MARPDPVQPAPDLQASSCQKLNMDLGERYISWAMASASPTQPQGPSEKGAQADVAQPATRLNTAQGFLGQDIER